MAEYVITANNVYISLDEFYDSFTIEAKIINEAKCIVANNDKLENFYIDEGLVSVKEGGNGYLLYFNNLVLEVETQDNMITYYDVK